jgi:excisionase family DNA binding protein
MENFTFEQTISILLADIAEIKEGLKMLSQGKTVQSMYTIAQACEVLNVSRTTFDRYAKDGKIATTKVMGKKYVSQAAINTYLGK